MSQEKGEDFGTEDFGSETKSVQPQVKPPATEAAVAPEQDPKPTKKELELERKLEELSALTKQLMTGNQASSAPNYVELGRSIANALREEKGPYRPENPDDDEDFDEKGTSFFCYSIAYFIASDIRNNREVFPPRAGCNSDGLIEFKFDMGKIVKSGKQTDVIHIAKYTSYSKKTTEWLRKHSDFGRTFFDQLPAKIDLGSVAYVRAMAASFAYVKDLHAIQLKNMASQYGVAPSENLEEMRHSIAYNMTEAQFVRAEDGRLLQKDAVDRMNSKFNDEYRQEMLDAAAHRQRVKSTPGVTINDGQQK